MNDGMLTVSNSEFGKLNILVENGKELFPANDAAKLLGYTNPYVHVLLGKHADTGNVVRNQTAHAGDSAVLTSMYSAMRRS